MTDNAPIACSLDPDRLPARLAEIAALGAGSLISREVDEDRHRLRFRADDRTRTRLAEIVEAEESCCSFLEFSVSEQRGEMTLTIDAGGRGRVVAAELADAFAGTIG